MSKIGITSIEILKRTFEGKTDPSKNDDALTSKYYPSKKYLLRYTFVGYAHFMNRAYRTKAIAEFEMEKLLKENIDCRDLESFEYNGHTFHLLRQLNTAESAVENIHARTGALIRIDGYSHNGFYEKGGKAAANIDLFIMDGERVVIPCGGGVLPYDERIKIKTHDLTYFSACCGKMVESHRKAKQEGFVVEGAVPATGDNYCNRCKRDVTRIGKVKNTPRNADIDKNGNWNYKTVSVERTE